MDYVNFTIENKYKFLKIVEGEAEIYFSTSEGGLNFNKNITEGVNNLNNLKMWFNLREIGYLNQIHSDSVHLYDGIIHEGDAILTNKKGVGIGVFTADCVPILIYDKKNGAIGAVHSGWKGTFKCIIAKAIHKMAEVYKTKIEDVSVYIGPHNMECCYEVGKELIDKFLEQEIYKNSNISTGVNLSMQKCIINQLQHLGLELNQIHTLDICTFCNKENNLYSYRKSTEKDGRMFSFIFVK